MPEKEAKVGLEEPKDENAVNHEIATLLLNLASRTHSVDKKPFSKPDPDVAMDLSNYSKPAPSLSPSSLPQLTSPTSTFPQPTSSTPNPYSLFPMSPGSNGLTALPSPYLLQNLLIGKMQQQLSSAPDRVSTTTITESPLPALSSLPALPNLPPLKQNGKLTSGNSNIPLLSGQIVAQLNALLFSIHGLTDKGIEAKVEGQLAAIFTRLQEIVTLVQITKQGQGKEEKVTIHSSVESQDELKISRPLEDYQKSLRLPASNGGGKLISSSVSPVDNSKMELTVSGEPQQLQLRLGTPYAKDYHVSDSTQPRKTVTTGRDMSYPDTSPPEKRLKMSPDDCSSSSSPATAPAKRTSKGGKGIRNRVFCGDCPGCLKNDDCGQCRYCRDKTKFGGQNRLRQKCLHRRCQMDTHRRSGQSQQQQQQQQQQVSPGAAPGEPTIYSGVDLAKLATQPDNEDRSQAGSGDYPIFFLCYYA